MVGVDEFSNFGILWKHIFTVATKNVFREGTQQKISDIEKRVTAVTQNFNCYGEALHILSLSLKWILIFGNITYVGLEWCSSSLTDQGRLTELDAEAMSEG